MEYTPQNMQTVSQLPLGMLWGGLEQLKEGQMRDQATLAATQQENIRKQQAHEMAQRQGEATLAGTQITNDTNAFALGQKRKTMDAETRSQLAKFGAEADEADWKSAVVKINQGRMRGDPAATELYELLPEITAARKLAEATKARAEQESKDKRYVADVGAQSRLQLQNLRSQSAREVANIRSASEGGPVKLEALQTEYTQKMIAAQDAETRDYYQQLLNMIAAQRAQSTPAGAAPQVDPNKLPQGSPLVAPVIPPIPLPPGASPNAATGRPERQKATQPKVVKTQQEYDALPPGALYLHPDGTTRKKK